MIPEWRAKSSFIERNNALVVIIQGSKKVLAAISRKM